MKLIIGLGNPGKNYQYTRHNVGFLFVEYLQSRHEYVGTEFKFQKKHEAELSDSSELTLLKPQTFMNESGKAVRSYLEYYDKNWKNNLDSLYVAHDDLDLEFGTYKIQFGKGPKVHNGLLSLYEHLHTQDFWHIRIGVDARGGERTIPGKDYVLSSFLAQEQEKLLEIFENIKEEIQL